MFSLTQHNAHGAVVQLHSAYPIGLCVCCGLAATTVSLLNDVDWTAM